MAQISQRQRVIRQNISGGTSAPASAAKGPTTGLGRAQVAPSPGRLGQNQAVKQGLSAAPQAGAPAPAQAQPLLPWDIAAANDEAGAQKRLANTNASLDAGWIGTENEFGLAPGFNDYASNPYSRAALLQRSYDNAKRGTLNSAGQQLYSGSYINAQNTNTHDFSMGRDELEKARGRAYSEYIGNKQRAQDEYNEALSNAAWARIQAGLESEPEPAPYGGGGNGGGNPLPKKLRKTPSKGTINGKKVAVSKGRKA